MTIQVWKLAARPDRLDLIPVPLPPDTGTLDAASLLLPGGAYTTFRTYEGNKVLRFYDHIQRLEDTARMAGSPVKLDEKTLRSALRQLVHYGLPGKDLRFRLTIDLEKIPGEVYISVGPLSILPLIDYQQGVRVITCDLQRQLPKAKLTRFIARAGPIRQTLPEGVNEAILVNPQGYLMEGLTSNFFAVRGKELWTAEEGVLAGITRSLVLEAARHSAIPLHLEPVNRSNLAELDEAMITSASRGLLPVRQIDDTVMKGGAPGGLTSSLMEFFIRLTQSEIETL